MGNKSNPIKVLIADGHVEYSKALRLTLEMEDDIRVVDEACDWQALEQGVDKLQPDVILMDIRLPNTHGNNDGIAATRQILLKQPGVAVIILTMLTSNALVQAARQAGARGLLLKDDHRHELVEAIRSAVRSLPSLDTSPLSSVDHYQGL